MRFKFKNGVDVFLIEHPAGDGTLILSAVCNGVTVHNGATKIRPEELSEKLKQLEEYSILEANLDLNL